MNQKTKRLTYRNSRGKAAFLLDGKEVTGKVADRLSMLEERMRWIPVDEKLPPDGEIVLVFGGKTMYTAIHNHPNGEYVGWWKLNSTYHPCNPKYWMKLPDVP